jgi:methylmalonyl-CoA/ethylmalonyl-CoA epimerase
MPRRSSHPRSNLISHTGGSPISVLPCSPSSSEPSRPAVVRSRDRSVVTDIESTHEGFHDIIERFDHVSIAVHNIEIAQALVDLLGGSHIGGGLSNDEDFEWVQFDLPGQGRLEMISPIVDDEDNFLNRYLEEHGEGLHHLTFKVRDIGAAVARARELGFTILGFDDSKEGWKEAFVHPTSAHGVLIQFAEFPDK